MPATDTSTDTSAERAHAVHQVVLLAVLGLAAAATVFALARALELRPALATLFGVGYPFLVAGLVLSLAAELAAAAGRVRALATPSRGDASWLSLRLLVVVLVLSWVVLLAVSEPFQLVHLQLACGLTGGAVAASILVRPALERARARSKAVRAGEFLLFQLCLFALLGELGLRALAAARPTPLLSVGDATAKQVLDAYRYEPGFVHCGFPCNSGGHYDEEFTAGRGDDPVVATIGDSFSVGIVPHAYHFTTVCEKALGDGVHVHNFGVPSIGPDEYLYMLKHEVLPLRPDVVVVDLFVGNDLGTNVLITRTNPGLRRWFDRENVLLWVVPRRCARIWRENRAIRGERPGKGVLAKGVTPEGMTWLDDPMQEPPTFSKKNYLLTVAGKMREVCTEDGVDYPALFERLDEMVAVSGDVPVCFMVIPDEFQVVDVLWDAALGVLADMHMEGPDELERFRPQRILDEWFESRGIPYLDLLPILRAVEPLEDGRRHVYHLRDSHFNAAGNRVVGEALADFLAERLPSREGR